MRRRWKMKESPTDVEEPKFFTGALFALPFCLLFWVVLFKCMI